MASENVHNALNPKGRVIVIRFVLFPALLYGIVALANTVFVHLVDWRAYQNPNERLLWDPDLPRTGLVILGDSVFAASYVDSAEQKFSFLLQQRSGKKVFNGALEGADPPDFLNAAELLTSRGMKGATVVLDIMPNRFLEFNQLENPSGNQARRFERALHRTHARPAHQRRKPCEPRPRHDHCGRGSHLLNLLL